MSASRNAKVTSIAFLVVLVAQFVFGVIGTAVDCPAVAIRGGGPDPGALIAFSVEITAGKSLARIPAGIERNRVEKLLLTKNDAYWKNLTIEAAKFGAYELNYNIAFQGFGDRSLEGGQIPLPNVEIMKVQFLEKAHKKFVNGIPMVVRKALVTADMLTDYYSPVQSRLVLGTIGGIASFPIDIPIDADVLIKESGGACMADFNYAYDISDPTSHNWDEVFPQAMYVQYAIKDDVRPANATERECIHFHCNLPFPEYDCVEALDLFTGRQHAVFNYQRLAWDQARADAARFNPFPEKFNDAAIRTIEDHLKAHNEVYRYVPANTAAAQEGMVRNSGWTTLLLYDADDVNIGKRDINIGYIPFHFEGLGLPDYPFALNGMYAYEALHGHLHFQSYIWSELIDSTNVTWNTHEKLGFCLVGVSRYLNTEESPFFHDFWNCTLQGIPSGWYDSYQRGIPGNWKDTTGLPEGPTLFRLLVNRDDQIPTGVKQCDSETGEFLVDPVSTVQSCSYSYPQYPNGWCVDAFRPLVRHTPGEPPHMPAPDELVFHHHGCGKSYVTDSDHFYGRDYEFGPTRDSGFSLVGAQLRFCEGPGANQVLLSCKIPNTTLGRADSQIYDPDSTDPTKPLTIGQNNPQVGSEIVRICESSRVLGCGTACRYRESLVTAVVSPIGETLVSFTCPKYRDPAEFGGAWSLYRASLVETLANVGGASVECTVVSA